MKKIIKWYFFSIVLLSASTALFMPVFYVYLSKINYNNTEIGLYYSFFWLASTLAEVPFGFFTDKHGTRKTLVIASVLKVLGFILLLEHARNVILLVIAAILTGVGEAGFSGCLGAWFVKEYNYYEKISNGMKIKNYFAKANIVSAVTGLIIGLFSGQILYNINFTYPIYFSIGAFVLMSFLFMKFPEDICWISSKNANKMSCQKKRKGLLINWIASNWKLFLVFLILSFPDVINCAPGNQWSKVFEDLKWNGYIWVAISLVSLMSNLLVDRCDFLSYNKKVINCLFLLETFLMGGMYLLHLNLYIIIFFFLIYVFLYEIHKILISSYLQEKIICSDDKRTTFTSMYNMINALIITIVLIVVGCLSDYIGMISTWFVVAISISGIYFLVQKKLWNKDNCIGY